MDVIQGDIKCVGSAECTEGDHSSLELNAFPLLAWCEHHPRHGSSVFTEDGFASVDDICLAFRETLNYSVVAMKFGTTPGHVIQAIKYANRTRSHLGE